MADPDLELRGGGGGGGLDLLAMAAIFLSVISSFFTQNKGGGAAPSPRSATGSTAGAFKVFFRVLSRKQNMAGDIYVICRLRVGPYSEKL